ncbi:MAG: RAMP superfamily CRISPR-associated protein [Aggregatilineales bacterium]
MQAITYRITLEEPLLATALEGDPNSAVSYDYIPGSVLRGAIIGMVLRKEGIGELDAAGEVPRRFFFSNATRFLNAYPVLADRRSLPAPQTWQQPKYATQKEITDSALVSEEDEQKKQSLRGKFVALKDSRTVAIADVERKISVHVQRERTYGRSRKDVGALFRYDALADGQVFEAVILCDQEWDAHYLRDLLSENTTFAMGGARSAGYGRVRINDIKIVDSWHETYEQLQLSTPTVITLLSDAIVRNEYGQYAPDLASLCRALGITPASVRKAFLRQSLVGGFNRKWGLPLVQMPVISMGSLLVIEQDGLDWSHLERLIEGGIGERRNEGFGRLAINWQRPDRTGLVGQRERPVPSLEQTELAPDSQDLWDKMQTRIQRQKGERDALHQASRLELKVDALPKSLINRLRQIVLSERLKPEPQRQLRAQIAKFFEAIKGKRAGRHFEKAHINGDSMEAWLTKTAEKPNGLLIIDAVLERAAKSGRSSE